ncbi:uncharacterized protein LOC111683110 isoform X3 [Lucilia cuprina]|uniref:uncharacterized protein LOC111683110 isoform X3 n=1 Tax=Lucilia cuprina TaxID=7375 RepID=UPI001F0553BD|nr:uncharacterized protein LOC111683110 isoform X3 [Lucilia cuprina]
MLNCTDLACVLHHHHFYAHLHHLKNHLQDDNDHQGSELSSFSHVDAPSDTIYMICGVVIAMLLVGLIIILVAVTINKLRKRDESITTTAVSIESQQHGRQSRSNSSDNNHYHEAHDQQIFTNSTAMTDCNDNSALELETITFARTSGGCNTTNGWVFPPKAPSPNISNCANHDSMITVGERNGFKGFKKQFSGRFKRLVSNKTKDTTSPIPAELKPQLKTIYVY